jgi:Na+/H+ antiporter NhaD/arsenite permease-like protein
LPDTTVAAVIFLVTYAIIVSERMHKTTAALAGAVLMIAFRIIDQEEAFSAIDFNVIFLLAGMMMIVNTLGKTGVFQWMAIRSAKLGRGRPLHILVILSLVTAGGSAFLDNVTTVVLIAPVTIVVAGSLGVSAVPFLIAEALASNIGGTATLIGDPPNILIASAAGLDFNDFVLNLAPVILIILGFWLLCVRFLFFRGVTVDEDARARVMAMDEREVLTNPRLLRISLIVLGLTLMGFLLHGPLDYEPATIALLGAAALLVIGREEPHDVLRDVEWSTLFFFVGLFMVVAGVEKVGLLDDIAEALADLTAGNRTATTFLILWQSALLSSIINQLPYTATMIPIVRELATSLGGGPGSDMVLWWALALGAGLGANLTVIAAAANVFVANLGERAGQRVPFWLFLRYGVVVTAGSMLLSTLYLWLRYLM